MARSMAARASPSVTPSAYSAAATRRRSSLSSSLPPKSLISSSHAQTIAQGQQRPAQPRADRIERHAEPLGQFPIAFPFHIGPAHRIGTLGLELAHAVLDPVAIVGVDGRLLGRHGGIGKLERLVELPMAGPARAKGVDSGVARYGYQPGHGACRFGTKGLRALPDLDEHVLQCVLGFASGAQDTQGDTEKFPA